MQKILITGASGTLARKVKSNFEDQGFRVVVLTTNKEKANGFDVFYWDTSKGEIDENSVEGVQHIIHLSGFSIIKKWTKKNKQLMYDSRVKASALIHDACIKKGVRPKTFISASAIGYYGINDFKSLKKEEDMPADDWLAKMCVRWEDAADKFSEIGSRVVKLRISLLITKEAGFLVPTLLSMRLGGAAVFGTGKQPIEWIHIDDACQFIDYSIKNKKVEGAYNLGSNQKLTQYQFMKQIKSSIAPYAILFRIPSSILKIIFGPNSVILEGGCKMDMTKFNNSGYKLKYANLESLIKYIKGGKK